MAIDVRACAGTEVSDFSGPQEQFANFFEIGFTKTRVVLDFYQTFEDVEPRRIARAHILTDPSDAVVLLQLLRAVVRRYAAAFPDSGVVVD